MSLNANAIHILSSISCCDLVESTPDCESLMPDFNPETIALVNMKDSLSLSQTQRQANLLLKAKQKKQANLLLKAKQKTSLFFSIYLKTCHLYLQLLKDDLRFSLFFCFKNNLKSTQIYNHGRNRKFSSFLLQTLEVQTTSKVSSFKPAKTK